MSLSLGICRITGRSMRGTHLKVKVHYTRIAVMKAGVRKSNTGSGLKGIKLLDAIGSFLIRRIKAVKRNLTFTKG